MPVIKVATPFVYTRDKDGHRFTFAPGEYHVADDVANHWFVKTHLVGYEPPQPKIGTWEYASHERARSLAMSAEGRAADDAEWQKQQIASMQSLMGTTPAATDIARPTSDPQNPEFPETDKRAKMDRQQAEPTNDLRKGEPVNEQKPLTADEPRPSEKPGEQKHGEQRTNEPKPADQKRDDDRSKDGNRK